MFRVRFRRVSFSCSSSSFKKYFQNMTTCSWAPLDIFKSPYAVVLLNQPIKPGKFAQIWNQAKFRVSVDGGTNLLYELQHSTVGGQIENPNLISGDFDSINHETVKKYYERKGVLIVHTPDQDNTDFTKALLELQNGISSKQYPKVDRIIAVVESTGRLDHIFANLKTLFEPQLTLPVFILGEESLTWRLCTGTHSIRLDKNYVTESNTCGIIPLCGTTHMISTGLKWNLNDNYSFDGTSMVSTSNTIINEIVEITIEKDVIWTMKTPQYK